MLSIYPNPTDDIININSSELISSVQITDMLGNWLYSDINLKAGDSRLNLSGLSPGIYILKINCKENIYIKKIIKN